MSLVLVIPKAIVTYLLNIVEGKMTYLTFGWRIFGYVDSETVRKVV